MVKVGPRVPPPTRRELARQEKEAKRAAQLANGLDPVLLGEPREHLALLLAKKTRSKRLETSSLEQSWKKWEKNQKRAQARRLAKSLKGNISSDGSQGYGDTSQSASSIDDDDTKSQSMQGDESAEVRLPYLDTAAGKTGDIPVGPRACALGPESGDLSSLSFTGTSVSECPEILDSGSVSSLPYASKTHVEISTGDSWSDNDSVSVYLPGIAEGDETLKTEPLIEFQGNSPSGKSIDPPTQSSQVLPDTMSRVSSLRRSRTVMNAALAPPRLSSRQGSAGSFIFSEPLDLSKYSKKSSVSANSQREDFGVPRNPASSRNDQTTPDDTGSFRELNLTPRAGVSAYVHARSPVPVADQTVMVTTKGQIYDINGCNPQRVIRIPPATPSDDIRLETGYTFGTITAPASLVKQIAKDTSYVNNDALDVGIDSENIPVDSMQLQPASIPKVSGPSEITPVKERVFRELSNAAISKQPESRLDGTQQTVTQFPTIDHTVRIHDPLSSNVVIDGPSSNIAGSDDPVVASVNEFVRPGEEHPAAFLAPAVCIVQDKKKPKSIQRSEVDETQKGSGSRRNLFNNQPAVSSMLRPAAPAARDTTNEQHTTTGRYPDTPLSSWSGIVPPAPTPATRSPLVFSMGLPSPPWSRSNVLPRHVADTNPEGGTQSRGFVSALKWVLRKTFGYFWQRRA